MMNSHISNTQELRQFNKHKILQTLYFHEPISRQEISQRTGLSVATITNLITTWIDEGVVLESGVKPSGGGRPQVILTLNKEYGSFVGIDLGETHIRFDLFDLKMNLQHSLVDRLDSDNVQPEKIVAKIIDGYHTLLASCQFPEGKIVGVGIGVPGVVDRKGGISVFAPNWGWHNVKLLTHLQEDIDVPIILDNGAKTMGLAEMWFGTKPDTQHIVALLLGTGVGTAIINDRQLQRGMTNSAGEVGHMTLDLNGRFCRCGGQGCLETYVGAPGIIQTLREMAPADSPLLQGNNQLDLITQLADAAHNDDPLARAVIKQAATYLGAAIANLINLYNPQTIVLGGWLGNQLGPLFLEYLHPVIQKYALAQPAAIMELQVSKLGTDDIAMGAACLVLEDFLNGTRHSWRLSTGIATALS